MASRRPRVRKDWVQNDESYGPLYTVNAGVAAHQAIPMTYSTATMALSRGGGNVVAGQLISTVAVPFNQKQEVYGYDVSIRVVPTAWALGSEINLGVRVVVAEMTPDTWQALFDPVYTMWNAAGNMADRAHIFADEPHLGERRVMVAFGEASSPLVHVRMQRFFRRPWRLKEDEAIFLYLENNAGAVATRLNPFCRTLMRVS